MSEPEILLEMDSPLGNVHATVEDDGRVVYLYLQFSQPDGAEPTPQDMKAVWVRNRVPAPDGVDDDALSEGVAPLLPRHCCAHPQGAPQLNEDDLGMFWFEEGNGAALAEGDRLLAVIPPWSGEGGFHGYATDCIAESPYAWPLEDDNAMHDRVQQASEYWGLWEDESFWERYSSSLIKPLEAQFGPHAKYYAIDGDQWPPKALLRFDLPDRYLLVTVGVSLLPQPNVERVMEDPSPIRRIELAAAVNKDCPIDQLKRVGRYLSGQSKYPWTHWSWLGEGHTMPCDSTPESCGGKRFPAALITSGLNATPQIDWPTFRDDPINLLWFFPITAAEREWAQANGSADLVDRLVAANTDITIRPRRPLANLTLG
jgi:hypothetical protein